MADVTVDINLDGVNAALGATPGFLGLTDNKLLRLNGHPVEIFHFTTDSDGAVNAEFQCNHIQHVLQGFIYNVTDDAFVTDVVIAPKAGITAGYQTIAVAVGTLGNSKVYVVFVVGGETR